MFDELLFMNSNQDLLQRLLHLYPLEELKPFFGKDGKIGDVIIDTVKTNTQKAIKEFSFSFQPVTKQNVYVYELSKNFVRSSIANNFPISIESETLNNGEYTFFCLPKVVYSVYLNLPMAVEELHFYQPVTIKVKNNILIISYTKLVKNITTYYPEVRQARKATEKNDEFKTLNEILAFFRPSYNPVPLDLNKGVKFLWEKDFLDCQRIQFAKQWSSSVEIMYSNLTFKQKYPNEYLEIVKKPIGSAAWKYLKHDDNFCESFVCDLTEGTFSVSKFAKHSKQIENVIANILANN